MARPQERKFLGFSFTSGKELKRKIAPKAIDRFKKRVREITLGAKGKSMEQVMAELARYVKGWRAYFGFCETPSVLRRLDSWIRRRVRCAFWRQWKTGRARFAQLVARGVSAEAAAQTAARMGLKPVAHIKGGFGEWKKSGAPVEAPEVKKV